MVAHEEQTRRILIVERDPETRDNLSGTLAGAGYIILSADDGPAGLQMILQERPDVALLDLNLPSLDGLAVTGLLRAQGCAVPVILTIPSARRTVGLAPRLNISACLPKPCARQELLETVERVLSTPAGPPWQEVAAPEQSSLELIQKMVVTLAHYVNNPLTKMALGVDVLRNWLDQTGLSYDPTVQSALRMLDENIEEIATVVRVLQRTDALSSTTYLQGTLMFDLEDSVAKLFKGAQ